MMNLQVPKGLQENDKILKEIGKLFLTFLDNICMQNPSRLKIKKSKDIYTGRIRNLGWENS